MPVIIGGQSYYRTVEVCRIAGVSRNTLFRWLKVGIISEPELRDWRGWRLYTQSQLDCVKARTSKIESTCTKCDSSRNRSIATSVNAKARFQ